LIPDGRVDVLKIRPIARLGYYDDVSIESIFEMRIPGNNAALLAGLEGTAAAVAAAEQIPIEPTA
jgi:hypothetical protein